MSETQNILPGSVRVPDRAGEWRYDPTGEVIDVYPLEPTGGQLCIWGPDIGISYTGAAETQGVWDTDEWQGHIPVVRFDDTPEHWSFVRSSEEIEKQPRAGGER